MNEEKIIQEEEKVSISEATEKLFNERKDFIVIGLTGRTCSGCTTIANLLSKSDKFEELGFPIPIEHDFKNNNERKYNVVYNYISENWSRFKVIQMKNIITSFILEHTFLEFSQFINQKLDNEEAWVINLKSCILNKEFREKYEEMNRKRLEVKRRVENNEESLKEDYIYEFYFEELPKYTDEIKKYYNRNEKDTYTRLYQIIADNIRLSGSALISEFNVNNIFRFPQRTNTLIKILRKRNLKKEDKEKVCVIIDCLRNPNEAMFFKERYSAFYLIAVNTDDKYRINRLKNMGFNKSGIDTINRKEYPDKKEKMKGEKKKSESDAFAHQNIQKCIEIADVFLYNPDDPYGLSDNIKREIAKYITLMMHPGIITPTPFERCMQVAYNAKVNSGCLSRQVGAVVTNSEFAIKSIGWNDVAQGQVPCNLRNLVYLANHEDKDGYSEYELKDENFRGFIDNCNFNELGNKKELKGRLIPYCFKDLYNGLKTQENQVYTRSLHAEENAFLQISKYGGVGLKGGYLFTTASPCELCAKKAYQLGISEIYYIDPYPGISEANIIESGTRRPKLNLFYGAIGRAYIQLYTPILPYKDEINMLIHLKKYIEVH